MALFDRFRRRQGPGAEGQMNMQDFDRMRRVPMTGGATEQDVDYLAAPVTPESAEAARLGARMGAEALMDMAGMGSRRKRQMAEQGRLMNPTRLEEVTRILMTYQGAKTSVNRRVIDAQQWWKLNNWEEIKANRGTKGATRNPSNTGWLWNCIVGKHADAIDSYPEPIILPRSMDDKEEAQRLSKIVPVVMEMNDFEETYSEGNWQKMQEGTGVYGVFWNSEKLNGLGDIDINQVNILNLYWEPGIKDIQKSKNVFYISYEDKADLIAAYPELEGKINTTKITPVEYKTDDKVDLSGKCAVIDWYYKKNINGRQVMHYCKYVNETCLFSSEEINPEESYYQDGEYPFVLDALFPVEGSPAGYGYIDIGKDTQTDIDELSQAMVLNAKMKATPRYFARKDGSVNEDEFADWSKPIVHVSGTLAQDTLRPVEVQQMGADVHNMLQSKIDEIKFVTGNTDVNNGGVPSGVTAASAIAALKEDSGRSSKDSTKAAYRSYRKIVIMVIERIRQFYDIPRQFRIMGPEGQEEFVTYDNAGLKAQIIPNLPGQEPGMRLPVFDIDVRAQRKNAYTKMSQNELALQFYDKGLLNPQMADQALLVIDMMDFRGKEELKKKIEAQGTMRAVLMQVAGIAMQLAQQYRPEIAEQLAMVMQGVAQDMGMAPTPETGGGEPARNEQLMAPSDNMSAPNPNENKIVKRAQEQAANASRPS